MAAVVALSKAFRAAARRPARASQRACGSACLPSSAVSTHLRNALRMQVKVAVDPQGNYCPHCISAPQVNVGGKLCSLLRQEQPGSWCT